MASQITNYQCPACTGPLHFGHASGKLECDYCGSLFALEEIEALYEEKNESAEAANVQAESQLAQAQAKKEEAEAAGEEIWDMDSAGTAWGVDARKMRAYNCPSCGAELIFEETTAATCCPYCNNPTIIPGKLGGTLKPDLVIPFKLDKEAALGVLKKYYQGKPLLPNAFANNNHIQEIQGVYVPFWLFDADVDADMTFEATRSMAHSTSTEVITETDHFMVRRSGTVRFEKIPVDGSSKMPDGHMDAIEPFDYADLKPFSLSYLPGYMADKYDVSKEECAKRAAERSRNSAVQAMRNTVSGYSSVVTMQQDCVVHPRNVKYALLPVWMLATQWNGEKFLFAMNGQTGKLIGDLPVDKKKLYTYCAGAFAAVTAVAALLFLL